MYVLLLNGATTIKSKKVDLAIDPQSLFAGSRNVLRAGGVRDANVQEPVDDVLVGSELVRRAVSMAQAANGLLSSAAPKHP